MFAAHGSMFGGLGVAAPAPAAAISNSPFPANPSFEPVLQQRIIGGNEAVPHSWPWTAQIVTGSCGFDEIGALRAKTNDHYLMPPPKRV